MNLIMLYGFGATAIFMLALWYGLGSGNQTKKIFAAVGAVLTWIVLVIVTLIRKFFRYEDID